MFPDDSFVARPPVCITREHRIGLEALAFAMRSTIGAIDTVHAIALKLEADKPEVTEAQRIALYTACWTIVDQIHFVRMLLKFMKFHAVGLPAEFFGRYEPATLIRNKMDHLSSNIPNLAKQSGRVPGIFGALTFFRFRGERENAEGKPENWGNCILIPFGVPTHPNHQYKMTNPLGRQIRVPLDLFSFSAFGLALDFYQLIDDLPKLAQGLEENVRASVMSAAMAESAKSGIDIAKLLERGGELVAVMDLVFAYDAKDVPAAAISREVI